MQALCFDKELIYRSNYPDLKDSEGEAVVKVLLAGIL